MEINSFDIKYNLIAIIDLTKLINLINISYLYQTISFPHQFFSPNATIKQILISWQLIYPKTHDQIFSFTFMLISSKSNQHLKQMIIIVIYFFSYLIIYLYYFIIPCAHALNHKHFIIILLFYKLITYELFQIIPVMIIFYHIQFYVFKSFFLDI